jgi:hypothetical protein
MVTLHGTYLIRYWARTDDSCRIEIVHVQSGQRAVVASMEEATACLDRHRQHGSLLVDGDREGEGGSA